LGIATFKALQLCRGERQYLIANLADSKIFLILARAITSTDFEMSFGYSVGDFVSIAAICWQVYKKCKDSSGEFRDVAIELSCLHSVLKETEEVLSEQNLSTVERARLQPLKDGVLYLVKELERRLQKYESLGTQSKRTMDRMGWATEGGVGELRQRLISQATMLDAFNNRYVPAT
jgi:hypothetical protein